MLLCCSSTMTLISNFLLSAVLHYLSYSIHVNAIWNGTKAKNHSRPYMVSLQINKKHICGGFLVSDQFVMSAAHCIQNHQKLTAVVGTHNLISSDGVRIQVKDYKTHPDYEKKCYHNDIMLLELEVPATNSNKVSWIRISETDQDWSGTKCSVSGWGMETIDRKPSDCLREASVYVFNTALCHKSWKDCYNKSVLCAGGIKRGASQGDSGGPLVCNGTAVGILSYIDVRRHTKPDGYTKLYAFFPWIKEIINGKERTPTMQSLNLAKSTLSTLNQKTPKPGPERTPTMQSLNFSISTLSTVSQKTSKPDTADGKHSISISTLTTKQDQTASKPTSKKEKGEGEIFTKSVVHAKEKEQYSSVQNQPTTYQEFCIKISSELQ